MTSCIPRNDQTLWYGPTQSNVSSLRSCLYLGMRTWNKLSRRRNSIIIIYAWNVKACQVIPIEVGCRGFIGRTTTSYLTRHGLTNRAARWLPQWHHPVAEAAGGARVWGTTGSRRNHLTHSGRWLTRVVSPATVAACCMYLLLGWENGREESSINIFIWYLILWVSLFKSYCCLKFWWNKSKMHMKYVSHWYATLQGPLLLTHWPLRDF